MINKTLEERYEEEVALHKHYEQHQIGVDEVRKVVENIVNKYPQKKNPRIKETEPVQFTERGRPSCLVGHVVANIFPEFPPYIREFTFGQGVGGGVGWGFITDEAEMFLLKIQQCGDNGTPWGQILPEVDKRLAQRAKQNKEMQ